LQEKLADVLINKENLTDKVKNWNVNALIESESYLDANIRSNFFVSLNHIIKSSQER